MTDILDSNYSNSKNSREHEFTIYFSFMVSFLIFHYTHSSPCHNFQLTFWFLNMSLIFRSYNITEKLQPSLWYLLWKLLIRMLYVPYIKYLEFWSKWHSTYMVSLKHPIPLPNFNISHFQSATLSHLWIQASCYVNLSNPNFVFLAFKVLHIHLQGNRNSRSDRGRAIQAAFYISG